MAREGTIGLGAAIVIAAALGISLQTGPKPEPANQSNRPNSTRRIEPAKKIANTEILPGCNSLATELRDFLDTKLSVLPEVCYAPGEIPPPSAPVAVSSDPESLKFVVAFLPDPVHTHLAPLFDQFITAIQEAAQDEKYDFDSSWLPWENEEESYSSFDDQKKASQEKQWRESQPGIILFRKSNSGSYPSGLVAFVVGEEATHGIHRDQFENALAWIHTLAVNGRKGRVGILGPTFSGSLSSLQQAVSAARIAEQLQVAAAHDEERLAIYSGSVSSANAAEQFRKKLMPGISFHSFMESDDTMLARFCGYMLREQPGFDMKKVAVISEDETAYGSAGIGDTRQDHRGVENAQNDCLKDAVRLFYPRDISALRGAYQTKSLFGASAPSQSNEVQQRNLPTDLADPAGRVHDSIRTYGGNQTPLSQEAFLMNIVAALHEFHVHYILLRSSNSLDQLFLANFLRRSYPNGRIVIFGSDLLFMRERGATSLGGTMLLTPYPLFPLVRDWTEHRSLTAGDRLFTSDTAEGTYIALRLLLNARSMSERRSPIGPFCRVKDSEDARIFIPAVGCGGGLPIPDYSPPRWMFSSDCGVGIGVAGEQYECSYPGPATWLGVIGMNRIWPVASLVSGRKDDPEPSRFKDFEKQLNSHAEPGQDPEMPPGMKILLLCLLTFSMFHAWCYWAGSYTAKPAFRAHFASVGDWRHSALALVGCSVVALLGISAGWGSGAFLRLPDYLKYPEFGRVCMVLIYVMAWLAVIFFSYTSWRLALQEKTLRPKASRNALIRGGALSMLLALCGFCFYRFSIAKVDAAHWRDNAVYSNWRAMHLASGVSPLLPVLLILAGLYAWFWISLHGLALLGPDRPCLPPNETLTLRYGGARKQFLRMFSQEVGGSGIEQACEPLDWRILAIMLVLLLVFAWVAWTLEASVPIRSLGAENYCITVLFWLGLSFSLMFAEMWRLWKIWERLRTLLAFLDRLPLRRTLAGLHGFSWGSVWKMSGNVLEVRYKVISRQLECMNHTIASLPAFAKGLGNSSMAPAAQEVWIALDTMQRRGRVFADWYSRSFTEARAGNLDEFRAFQESVADTAGTILSQLLIPFWGMEKSSLIVVPPKGQDSSDESKSAPPPLASDPFIQNAEEFVCLAYLGFVQNILGRLRTVAMSIAALFIAPTVALSTYPFDPRQAVSIVLIVVFVIVGGAIVKVYAEMHRDATLSHVTNTKPGELGTEFWIKIIGFGFAPFIGLLTRIVPGIGDFLFSWLQPGLSALK